MPPQRRLELLLPYLNKHAEEVTASVIPFVSGPYEGVNPLEDYYQAMRKLRELASVITMIEQELNWLRYDHPMKEEDHA